jgi:hypothetical protein
MDRREILDNQLRFFIAKRAGCLFAAFAARNPSKYGWVHRITPARRDSIDRAIRQAIAEPGTTTLSLVFPDVSEDDRFLEFIETLKQCSALRLESTEEILGSVCLGFRVRVGEQKSYVTGFGNFPFLPATRRSPFVELTMRVKPRPDFSFVFKEAPQDVIHLADLDMLGMPLERMKKLWNNSFVQTRRILQAAPDVRSAARTTYSLPKELLLRAI